VSAYGAAIFHLMTHAFFKALLFLGAGSAIIAMHHEQDIRKMGGLRKYMPITYWTMVIGSLALCGVPPFAGFFSKDSIIEMVHASTVYGHSYAYFAVVAGVFVTAFYSFRMLFIAFHGKPRYDTGEGAAHAATGHGAHIDTHAEATHDEHGKEHHGPPKESPWVVTVPLIALAIPSVIAGWLAIEPMLVGNYWGSSIAVAQSHPAVHTFREEWHGIGAFIEHGVLSLPFWLVIAAIVLTWYMYLVNTALPDRLSRAAGALYTLLVEKYYFDKFNDWFFAGGARGLGAFMSNVGELKVIDGFFVNGAARVVGWTSALLRHLQTGYVYHYAFTMIIGLFALLTWWVGR
jgi:NADH-quinone oxidoreductase subunit L